MRVQTEGSVLEVFVFLSLSFFFQGIVFLLGFDLASHQRKAVLLLELFIVLFEKPVLYLLESFAVKRKKINQHHGMNSNWGRGLT